MQSPRSLRYYLKKTQIEVSTQDAVFALKCKLCGTQWIPDLPHGNARIRRGTLRCVNKCKSQQPQTSISMQALIGK